MQLSAAKLLLFCDICKRKGHFLSKKGKKRAKNELIIDAETEGKFRRQLYEFYYSIVDINSFKVEANYKQIAENIEKDFIDKDKSGKKENKK